MGSGQSSGTQQYINTFEEDPYPPQDSLSGVSIGTSQGCTKCVLKVNAGISTSSVKLRREYGTVSVADCKRYGQDYQDVKQRRMAFNEFKRNLMNGKYLIPI